MTLTAMSNMRTVTNWLFHAGTIRDIALSDTGFDDDCSNPAEELCLHAYGSLRGCSLPVEWKIVNIVILSNVYSPVSKHLVSWPTVHYFVIVRASLN